MLIAIFALVVIIVAVRVERIRRQRSNLTNPTVLFTVATLLASVAFGCELFPQVVDRSLGAANISDVIFEVTALLMMLLSLLFVYVLRRREISSRVVLGGVAAALLMCALVVVQWSLSSDHGVETPRDAGFFQVKTTALPFVTVAFFICALTVYGVLVWQCTFGAHARNTERRILRASSAIMGCGLAVMAVGDVVIIARMLGPAARYDQLTGVFWALVAIQTLVFSLGLLLPIPGGALERVKARRLDLARMDKLWRHLQHLFPATELRFRRAAQVPVWGLSLALTRIRIEISDGLGKLIVPIDAVDEILNRADLLPALSEFIWSVRDVVADIEGEPANTLLPGSNTLEQDRAQILALADAFNDVSSSLVIRP